MAGLWPLSRQQVFKSGKPVPGAKLYLFDGGTSTPRTGYRDSSLTSAHANPIVADADGRLPVVFLASGFYRQRLTTKTGTLIYDDDGLPVVDTTTEGSGTSVDPDSVFKTRDIKIRFDDQALDGYVRLNGRTIGSASSGATERANADTQSLYEELWAFANISVAGGKGASASADFAANKAMTLPDMAGRMLAGMDDLGAGSRGILTQAVLGTDPTEPGSYGGDQTIQIQNAYLPVTSPWTASTSGSTSTAADHAHAVTGTTGSDGDHQHQITTSFAFTGTDAGGSFNSLSNNGGAQNLGNTSVTGAHTHSINFASAAAGAHSHTISATTTMNSNVGGGQAFNKLSPLMTFMIYIRL